MEISASISVIHYKSITYATIKYARKGTQDILHSLKCKFHMCIELYESKDLRLPYRLQTGTMQMAAVPKMRDAIYYGRVRTWYLTLRAERGSSREIASIAFSIF